MNGFATIMVLLFHLFDIKNEFNRQCLANVYSFATIIVLLFYSFHKSRFARKSIFILFVLDLD